MQAPLWPLPAWKARGYFWMAVKAKLIITTTLSPSGLLEQIMRNNTSEAMKNSYLSPVVEIHRLEQAQVLCASDAEGLLQDYTTQSIWDFETIL